jgi:hypothetical protein
VKPQSFVSGKSAIWLILAFLGLLAIWAWTIPSALNEQRTRRLLATEGVLAEGKILRLYDFWISPETGYFINYQFTDSTGKVWRGWGKGFPAIDTRTGQKVLLVTYAPSDPSINRLGNYTHESLRHQLEVSATTFPLFILVVQGGGLSLLLIILLRRGAQVFRSTSGRVR